MAVQLRAVGAARIIAVDANPAKVAQATRLGADIALLSDGDTAARIRRRPLASGADVVFDFVGVAPSVAWLPPSSSPRAIYDWPGWAAGSSRIHSTASTVPWGVTVQTSYGGTRADPTKY